MTRSVGHDNFCFPCPRFNLASEGLQFPRENLNISHELTDLFPRVAPYLRLWLMIWISILTCSQFDPSQSYSIVYKLIYPVPSVISRPSPSSLIFMTIGDSPSTPPLTARTSPRERFQSPARVRRLSRALSSPSRIAMTTDSPPADTSPTGPSASYTNISPEQLADLLSKVGQNHGPAPRTLATPRVGRKGPAGVWTGFGAGCKGTNPKSATCMRDFDTSVVKSFTAMAPANARWGFVIPLTFCSACLTNPTPT